ncbi:MAG: helix-hairpin-helix domain-containing protein [Chitinophagaceae bacterium]
MGWKESIGDYLHFTRRDRIAIITLLLLILSIFFLPAFIPGKQRPAAARADTAWISALKRMEKKEERSTPDRNNYDNNSSAYQYDRPGTHLNRPKGELFYFDPNTLTGDDWQKLGLRDKTIHTILNYLSKGGKFRRPEDLERIYGLFPDEYERIAPYIRIESASVSRPGKNIAEDTGQQHQRSYTSRFTVVDINAADTAALVALPGIGNKLAARIISFRDKLGGFYSVDQVGETFGLPDSTFQKIMQYLKLENVSIRKININTATVDELKAHPYIRWALANPIVAYRNEHGNFARVEDVKKVMAVTDDVFKKIVPYLTTEK